jgi:uncharacterized protein YbjT (DUF2867 family)
MRVLVTGVSGWAGDGVARALQRSGNEVIGLSRDPSRVHVEFAVLRGDAATGDGLDRALDGVDVAYYFIHSLESGNEEGFAIRDKRAAENFVAAAQRATVERIIFLGVIAPRDELSAHLRSRIEVEDLITSATPTSLSLRASMVIDARSPGFRFMIRLAEKAPVIARTPASEHVLQPIDARDVVACMVRAATSDGGAERVLDIAGPDQIRLGEVSERIATALGVDRDVVEVPRFDPELAARELTKLTGDDPAYIAPLMETLAKGDLVARHDGCALLGVEPRFGVDDAIRDAVRDYKSQEVAA